MTSGCVWRSCGCVERLGAEDVWLRPGLAGVTRPSLGERVEVLRACTHFSLEQTGWLVTDVQGIEGGGGCVLVDPQVISTDREGPLAYGAGPLAYGAGTCQSSREELAVRAEPALAAGRPTTWTANGSCFGRLICRTSRLWAAFGWLLDLLAGIYVRRRRGYDERLGAEDVWLR